MVFATYLDEHLWQCYTTVHHHLAAIHLVHIALGLPNPLQDCPHLQQLLHAICRQQPLPQLDLGHQGITMDFLCRTKPLHCPQLPRDRVLWTALTIGHYSLFCSGELAQLKLAEAGAPCFICVQDVTPHFSGDASTMFASCWPAARWTPSTRAAPSSLGAQVPQCAVLARLGISCSNISEHTPPQKPPSSR